MSDIDEARARARRLYKSKGLQGVYMRGFIARQAGTPIESCPYRDDGATWARTFRKAWRRGWEAANELEVA